MLRTPYTLTGLMLTWAWLGLAADLPAQEPGRILNNGVTSAPAGSQVPAGTAPAAAGAAAPVRPILSRRPDDERAIQAVADAYVRAYNARDARSLAALFTEDGEFIDEHGDRLEGRATIEAAFAAMFRERPGTVLEIATAALRFLGPDAAKEGGRTRVTPPGGLPPSTRHYTVLFVKEAGRWMYSSVREELEAGIPHRERLGEVAWLVGDWIDESAESTVHSTYRWSPDQNFLLRDYTVHVQGKPAMTVSERIGWDPLTRQIKSWVFDSEGGYGDALWTSNGTEWLIKSKSVMPDGRVTTATHVLSRLSPTSARWVSLERTVGDQIVPDQAEFVMVRRAPLPATSRPAPPPASR